MAQSTQAGHVGTVASDTGSGPGTGKAQEVAHTVADKGREVAEQAREVVGDAGEKVGGTVQKQVDERSTMLGEQVEAVADAIEQASQALREQGKDAPARIVDQMAAQARKLGDYLVESDSSRLAADFERFGRSRPVVIAGAAAIVGFAASRFLKAAVPDASPSQVGGGGDVPKRLPVTGDTTTVSVGSSGDRLGMTQHSKQTNGHHMAPSGGGGF